MAIIIAEAGVNHNGEERLACELIDVAKMAGADVVKFQTFKANKLVTVSAGRADYQVANDKTEATQREMLSALELSYDCFRRLARYCETQGIEFLSTAFDSESLAFLTGDFGQKRLKIPSGELSNAPFVLEHARTGLELIVSTGMASLAEIEEALSIIAFGLIASPYEKPGREAFGEAYAAAEARALLREKVILLHCTTEYPAPLQEINLMAMTSLEQAFGLRCGYSDHSDGISVPIAAAALGAVIIEKHFTLDRTMKGPDHVASLEPSDLAAMVAGIRDVQIALGDGVKRPMPSEVKNKAVARKSLVAAHAIPRGKTISAEDLTIIRPGGGASPIRYWDVIGTLATRDYAEHESIE